MSNVTDLKVGQTISGTKMGYDGEITVSGTVTDFRTKINPDMTEYTEIELNDGQNYLYSHINSFQIVTDVTTNHGCHYCGSPNVVGFDFFDAPVCNQCK